MWTDLRHAARALGRDPGFAVLAVLTLAIGIGATTAIFSVVNGVLLRPLPYPEPDRILRLWEQTDRGQRVSVSFPNFTDWHARATSFEAMAAYEGGSSTVLGGREAVFVQTFLVSADFFGVFGVAPAIGRTFAPEENRPGGTPAAVVSNGFWAQVLGSPASLESIKLQIAGFPVRVVGVMPAGFAYPDGADIWVPKELVPDGTGRTGHNLDVIGRVRTNVSLTQADAEMDAIAARLQREHAGDNDAIGVTMLPLHDALTGGSRQLLKTLLAAVGLVLLIACVNVAGALLARGEERRRELAIRASLGARRARLVGQLLTENLLLAIAGGAGGLLLAGWLVRTLLAMHPAAVPRSDSIGIDLTVMAFALLLALLTPLVFGLLPALQSTRAELREDLAQGSRSSAAPLRGRVRRALIIAEVAVALLLLVGSALLIRSFWNVMTVDKGFAGHGVVTADLVLPGTDYPDAARASGFYRDLLPKLRSLPGVQSVGAINAFPLSGSNAGGGFYFESDSDPDASQRTARYAVVTDDYFSAMGIPLIKGRVISDADVSGAEVVVVVNQAFVASYLGNEEPIGKRFRYFGMDSSDDPFMTIVGVVGNVRRVSLEREVEPVAYVSYLQRPRRTQGPMTIAIRPAQPSLAESLPAGVRRLVHDIEPDVPIEFSTLGDRIGQSVAGRRFVMVILSAFAGIALLLAAIGIHGILTYSVAQRTREIGIRMALGARPGSVIRLMVGGVFSAAAFGVVLGAAAAVAATRVLESFLYGVEPLDPVAFGAGIVLLLAVAWVAGYIPARRAARIDPAVALRT